VAVIVSRQPRYHHWIVVPLAVPEKVREKAPLIGWWSRRSRSRRTHVRVDRGASGDKKAARTYHRAADKPAVERKPPLRVGLVSAVAPKALKRFRCRRSG
jgi:hypothetical protein